MKWRLLFALLVVILAGAIAFAVLAGEVEPPRVADVQPVRGPVVKYGGPVQPPPGLEPSRPEPTRPQPQPAPPPPGPPAWVPQPPPAPPPPPPPEPWQQGGPPEEAPPPGSPLAGYERWDGGTVHGLDKAGIQGAIKEKIPEIKECYEAWLQQRPDLGGRVQVTFSITADPENALGLVERISIADGGLGHVAMEGCVLNVMKSMRFEAPKNGQVKVNYPFRFAAGPDAG